MKTDMPTIPMIDEQIMEGKNFLRLLSWVSPAFPTGGYAYSHGLEWAVENDDVHNVASLCQWIEVLLHYGSLQNDFIILQAAWDAAHDQAQLYDVAEFACACASSRERYEETVYQGEAFQKAATAWNVVPQDIIPPDVRWPLPVAQGVVFRYGGISRQQAALAGGVFLYCCFGFCSRAFGPFRANRRAACFGWFGSYVAESCSENT